MELVQIIDNTIVEGHPIAIKGFCSTLAKLAKKDYKKDYALHDEVFALDMDAYEISISNDAQKTIDAAVGIADYNDGKESSHRLLLVELRMDYDNKDNPDPSVMLAKEVHTRDLLLDTPLDPRCFFIFNNSCAPLVENRISRLKKEHKSYLNWQIVNPEKFNNCFRLDKPPYSPKTNVACQMEAFKNDIQKSDLRSALYRIEYLQREEEHYLNRYNIPECTILERLIKDMLREASRQITNQSDDILYEYLEREEKQEGLACRMKNLHFDSPI